MPERTCIVTRETKSEPELVRFVYSPDGQVVPDLRHKLPGRGAYVSVSRSLLEQAVKKGSFSRAFKRKVEASSDLPQLVEALLRKEAVASLSMANKAGEALAGFDTIAAEAVKRGFIGFLHGADASEQGLQKLERIAMSKSSPLYRSLTIDELSTALSRENTVHVALKPSPVSRGVLARLKRLDAYLQG